MASLISSVNDLLFPSRCVVCGVVCGSPLCLSCLSRLPYLLPPVCPRCGTPVPEQSESCGVPQADQAQACSVCAGAELEFSQCRSIIRFEGSGRDVIHALKYANSRRLARVLAAVAAERADPAFLDVDAITFVPLRKKKQAERGYNQSELAARALARQLDVPVSALLQQVRPTADQAQLSARERRANVQGAFDVWTSRAQRVAQGRRVLLLDDVFTTGATVGECARALRQVGVAEVRVLTLARAPLC